MFFLGSTRGKLMAFGVLLLLLFGCVGQGYGSINGGGNKNGKGRMVTPPTNSPKPTHYKSNQDLMSPQIGRGKIPISTEQQQAKPSAPVLYSDSYRIRSPASMPKPVVPTPPTASSASPSSSSLGAFGENSRQPEQIMSGGDMKQKTPVHRSLVRCFDDRDELSRAVYQY